MNARWSCWTVGILLTLALTDPAYAAGETTLVAGESIAWNFDGIPETNMLFPPSPCTDSPISGWYSCVYTIMDAPYGQEITFTASILPTQGDRPYFELRYYDISDFGHYYPHRIDSRDIAFPSQLDIAVSFFIPARASDFQLIYQGGGAANTNVYITFPIANYDAARANLRGGPDISPDTEFCDDWAGPGTPRVRKYRNRRGAGPGT